MYRRFFKPLPALMVLAACVCTSAHAEKVYKWVDEDGVTHYGDRVPAQYSDQGHSILNKHGVQVGEVEGALTDEELAAKKLADAEAARLAKEREAAKLRDRVLLTTYLSVEEIEALRDRRIELVQAQIHVTEIYLDNLRRKLGKLEKESQKYSPYNTNPKAKPIDEKLARELADTIDSIMLYEETLKGSQAEQTRLQNKFSSDISRFKELKVETSNRN